MVDPGRLDSWKQIAAYLGKSERTVRRWQEAEGLPVHRHKHKQRASVWAHTSELDAWLQQRLESSEERSDVYGIGRRLSLLAATLLVAISVVAASVLLLKSERALPLLPEEVQITAVPGNLMTPAFSPSGAQVVFHWTPSDGPVSGLFIKTLGNDNLAPLLTTPRGGNEFVYSPAWSPDGTTIAFLRRSMLQGSTAFIVTSETWLCLVGATGGPERRIVRLSKDQHLMANDNHISWAPNGQFIYAPMSDQEHLGIYRISIKTGEAVRVTPGKVREFAPALSVDGRALAFKRREGQYPRTIEQVLRQDLTADGLPSGNPRELYFGRSASAGLAWLPSGKELIFCTSADSFFVAHHRLFRLSAEPPSQLIPLGAGRDCSTISISRPDGSGKALLVDAGVRVGTNILFRGDLRKLDLFRPIAPSSRFDALPRHSPDGSAIAFISNRSGPFELWLARGSENTAHRLTTDSEIASPPAWSPDGGRLVFASARLNRDPARIYSINIVAASGGDPVKVPVAQEIPSDPVWSPDGAWIYYWSGTELWRTHPDGTEATKVGEYSSNHIRSVAVAGDALYYICGGNAFSICRAPFSGGASERLAEGVGSMFFAVSREFVYYLRQPGSTLVAQPIAGGRLKEIGQLPGPAGQRREVLSVSPDDTEVVWSAGDRPQTDLYLVRGIS